MLGIAGAVLLTGATLPQALRLWRSRSARDFSWGYIALSFTGCLFLTIHAVSLQDVAFALVNGSGLAFWLLVAIMRWLGDTTSADQTLMAAPAGNSP